MAQRAEEGKEALKGRHVKNRGGSGLGGGCGAKAFSCMLMLRLGGWATAQVDVVPDVRASGELHHLSSPQ